jgi:CheY-like chemotaxis protein
MATILVVDDDPVILKLVKETLLTRGYIVNTAPDARQGLNLMLKDPPDLAILDYIMPDRDGLSLLKDIRAVPDLRLIPIIILTSSTNPEVVSKAIQLGVTDFLAKPILVFQLLERVEKNLQKRNK